MLLLEQENFLKIFPEKSLPIWDRCNFNIACIVHVFFPLIYSIYSQKVKLQNS